MKPKISQDELNKIKAELLVRYNYQADDFSIVLVDTIQDNFAKVVESLNATTEVAKEIQKLIKPIQLTTKGQAFWLYLAPTFCFTWIAGILLWGGYIYFDFGQRFKHYKYADEIEQLLEKSEIKSDDLGNQYIVLKPAITLKNAKIGKHYFYSPIVKSITVPISKADKTGFSLFSNPLDYFKTD